MPCPEWFPIFTENKREFIISMCAGLIFSSGWWIFIDVAVVYSGVMNKHKIYYLPGICGTVAMIVVNLTPYRTSRDNIFYNDNKCTPVMTLTILFIALVMAFGAFTWSFYIMVADFFVTDAVVWIGVGIMLQNLFILLSNLMMKFSKEKQNDDI